MACGTHRGRLGGVGEYARGLAEKEGLEYVGITRSKIYKKQLIEVDGERFFITGKKEMRNATQLAFSDEQMKLLAGDACSKDAIKLLDMFNPAASSVSDRLLRQLKIEAIIEKCATMDAEDVVAVVKRCLPW